MSLKMNCAKHRVVWGFSRAIDVLERALAALLLIQTELSMKQESTLSDAL
jgi:hypothetical protein